MDLVRAELLRANTRLPRLILLGVITVGLVLFVMMAPLVDPSFSYVVVATSLSVYAISTASFLAVFETVFVWGDMCRAKIPGAAICRGIPRWQIVLGMWLVTSALVLIDLLVFMLLLVIGNLIVGGGIPAFTMNRVFITLGVSWLYSVAILAVAIPIVVMRESVTFALIFEVLIVSGAFYGILDNTKAIAVLAPLKLGQYTLTGCSNIFAAQLTLGCWNIPALLGIFVYVIIGLVIAFVLFRKKELSL